MFIEKIAMTEKLLQMKTFDLDEGFSREKKNEP